MATKGQLLRDVRVILNENEDLQPLLSADSTLLSPLAETGTDDMALERDTLLSTLIAPAIDKVHKLGSGKMLNDVTKRLEDVDWQYDNHCQWCKLPDYVLFPSYVNVEGWDRPVVSFISEYGNEYDMCRSGIVGVTPFENIPACAVMPYSDFEDEDSSMRLEAYPLEPESAKKIVRYIPKAETGDKSESYEYPISGECYWAVVYTIASLYYLSVDDRKRAEDMSNEAADILKNDRT